MEITVISEEENPMLHRTDVRFRVSHAEATPDRLAIRDSLAARLNKDADEVVVRTLDTKFGMRETIGEAKVYQGADFAKDVEQDYLLDRNKIGDGHEEDGATDAESEEEPATEPEVEEESEAEAEPEAEAEQADEPDEGAAPEEAEESAEAEEGDDEGEAAEAGDESAEDEETEE